MRRLIIKLLIASLTLTGGCSEDFLEITPNALLDEAVLANYEGVDALLIGAYSLLDGIAEGLQDWGAATSNWMFGSIRGMEANLGSDAGDPSYGHAIKNFSETPTNGYLNSKWRAVYEGVSRCNRTIAVAEAARETGTITKEEYDRFIRQARALRGFYHFEAWRFWADPVSFIYVTYVDEHTNWDRITNTEDIRDRIIEDLAQGTLLPYEMDQVGRFNRTVSQVLLAKALMQMYGDYEAALPLLSEVESGGTNPAGEAIGLMDQYGDIFDLENRNGIEAIYTVQYSVNDGSGGLNGGYGEVLNFPYQHGYMWLRDSSFNPAGCCGFFQPTQDFVNSFRTGPGGLPYLDSYNDEKVTSDQGIAPSIPWSITATYNIGDNVSVPDPANPFTSKQHYISLVDDNTGNDPLTGPAEWIADTVFTEYADPVDPRLDWSVGRRGIPYWDWGEHSGQDWIRDQSYAGPYSPKKQVYKRSQEGIYTEAGNWTSGFTANGYRLIRFADVLLLKAECEAATGTGDLGLGEVNAIRARAANSDGFVKEADGITPAANYVIGLYPSFPDQEFALKAIRFERKLELGQEGHRFFDLQRWGEVESELNRILVYEKTMEWGSSHYWAAEVGPEDVNFPIPQRQIDLSHGRLLQNRTAD